MGLVGPIKGAPLILCAVLGPDSYPRPSRIYKDEFYLFPLQVGGNGSNPLGDVIENIEISNIKASSKCHLIICLAAGGARVRNIKATYIKDENSLFNAKNIVAVYTGYGEAAQPGDIKNIRMEHLVSHNSDVTLKINAPLQDCEFGQVKQNRKDGLLYEITQQYEQQ